MDFEVGGCPGPPRQALKASTSLSVGRKRAMMEAEKDVWPGAQQSQLPPQLAEPPGGEAPPTPGSLFPCPFCILAYRGRR